ncbi:MAG: hypothetical protein IT361_11960 [Gemmatimonadaceae bacterium]|nr:hypothetical protein [Gemmatimonadaceae bacterium]
MATLSPDDPPAESVGALAALYLGNILYALEAAARAFDDEGKADHGAFYRGIARKLAEARGREKTDGP